jgi:hypothetical protein
LLALISQSTTSTSSTCPIGSACCIEWGEDTETKEKAHGNPARPSARRTSHATRFGRVRHLVKLLEKKAFCLVGAPGLEPGTR